MNYETMEAGHEMDGLIAEQVMGFKSVSEYNGLHHWFDGERMRGQFCPSINIAHAWEVVERLKELGHGVEILCNPGHTRIRTNYGERVSVMAKTVPLAICRAALLAMKPEGK